MLGLRASWAPLLAAIFLLAGLPGELTQDQGLSLLAQLGMARSIFWLAAGALLVGLALPLRPLARPGQALALLQYPLVLALALWVYGAIRALAQGSLGYLADELAGGLLLLNLLAMLTAGWIEGPGGPLNRLSNLPLLGEALLPLGFWAVRSRRRDPWSALPRPGRALALALLCLTAGLITLHGMLDAPWRPEAYRLRSRLLWERECYGLVLDSSRRLGLAAGFEGQVLLVDTAEPRLREAVQLDTRQDLTDLAWDSRHGMLYAIDAAGEAFGVEPLAEPRVTRLGRLAGERPGFVVAGGVAADGSSLWLSLESACTIERLGLPGLQTQAEFAPAGCPTISALLLLEQSGLLYALSMDGRLLELDAQSMRQRRRAQLPGNAAGLAHDPLKDRLLISLPAEGRVLVLKRPGMKKFRSIQTMVGVRALAVEPAERLLFTAGFGPYLEIFDLDSGKLVVRAPCPPWVRRIAVDPAGRRVLLTDKHIGLSFFDYGRVVDRSRRWHLPHDPFFALVRWAGLGLLRTDN